MNVLIALLTSLSCLLLILAAIKLISTKQRARSSVQLVSTESNAAWRTAIRAVRIPAVYWCLTIATVLGSILIPLWPLLGVSALIPFVPGLRRWFHKRHRTHAIYVQMDGMLANLANAIPVSGNLRNAIEDVMEGEPEPMRSELAQVLHEIRLGKTEDDALRNLANRSDQPLFKTAVTAIIVGKTSGGSLEKILSGTSASIRELKRLDGVLKTKTSEARMQAWVIGLVPFVLCGALQVVNPEWLMPIWTTPFGNILLAGAALMEITAILLIRKILAVEL